MIEFVVLDHWAVGNREKVTIAQDPITAMMGLDKRNPLYREVRFEGCTTVFCILSGENINPIETCRKAGLKLGLVKPESVGRIELIEGKES